ncbi:hypothetical protein GCM10010193_26030 [Kitasatospora atroaurantiaca]|uniref:Uncharacterized protein n=1 Tax=Kitasatospora atroaurantiaca TaxID=285545 RepID=A0A561F0E8_9ACTN|nr:hypothetical protein [Kitasatospora atroaurantiaca]TWE21338.1 hypothetical protein FB465_6511 [Kitasatospora atroaurantiaca]
MNEEISRQLREAAAYHHPDRAKIIALVEQRAAGPALRHRAPSIARSGRRVALAALATAGILATGGLAVAGIVSGPSPSPAVTSPAAPSPVNSPTPSTPSTATGPAPSATGGSRPSPSPSLPTGRVQNGPLWTEGSVDGHSTIYWGQSNLVLGASQPLTSLTVELRVAQTGGVRDTGTWRTLPADDFTVTVQESGGSLVYRWVLKPGRTVPAGQHEFAAQFNHATGARAAAGDSYRVDARTAGGSVTLRGGFASAH